MVKKGMTMDESLLKRVETWLRRLKRFEHFDMESWVDTNSCGTSYCIAGKVMQLSGYKVNINGDFIKPDGKTVIYPAEEGARLLGITQPQAMDLFYISNWPHHIYLKYCTVTDKSQKPKIAADRIKYFIENHQ